jgi:hypothetical protein
LVVLVFALGCIGNEPVVEEKQEPLVSQEDQDFDDYLDRYKQRRLFKDTATKPNREAYGISKRVFEELPPFPEDFLFKTYLIKVGKFFDLASLGPEYWKQPEFDPEFTRQGLKYWHNWADPNFKKKHWSTMGVRSYPYNQYVDSVPGDSFNITLFFSTDWNVETYQGVGIKPIWVDAALTQEGQFIEASEEAWKHINVNVTPHEFLLTPAFPQFTYNWTHKLTFTGKIAEDTPPGTYILGMELNAPSTEQSDKWFLEYLNLYSEGVQMIKLDKPYLQAFITVRANE